MLYWIPYAFVRIVLFFIAGIVLAINWPGSIPITIAIGLFLILILIYLFTILVNRYQYKKINPGVVGLLALFIAGYINVYFHNDVNNQAHLLYAKDDINFYQVVVNNYPEEKNNSWKVRAELIKVKGNTWAAAQGNILLYFAKGQFELPFKYGDVLLIKGHPQEISPPANPGEFDYRSFMASKNIFHQDFVKQSEVIWIKNVPPNWFMCYAIKARLWAQSAITRNVVGDREQSIATALVLGVTDGLDNETLKAYAATGAMHVLAVSGLHVGILYWIVTLLFKPFSKSSSGKWVVAFISLGVLWAYAFITGLSPSVLRAVTMFSFIAIAKPLNQRTNVYNILCASAFFLLVYQPQLIMSVGFQLSYLAVLGIVYLHPRLYNWWEPKFKVVDELWKITSVSIAAQVATFSLGLFYFHQFPNYFLLSNLFVIPLSFVILIIGLAIVAFNYINPLAEALGYVLTYCVKFLNYSVFTIESFPFSVIDNIYINAYQCGLILLMVVFTILFFHFKFRVATVGLILLVLAFVSFQWNHFLNNVKQQKITVYKISGHSAIELTDRGRAVLFTDSLLLSDKQKLNYLVQPHHLLAGVSFVDNSNNPNFLRSLKGCKVIMWNGKTILHVVSDDHVIPLKYNFDYIIISNDALPDIAEFFQGIKAKYVIIDTSNTFRYANKFLKESSGINSLVHSVWHEGAFDQKI